MLTPNTHDDEENSEHAETHKLYGFATPYIDDEEGRPVTWDQTSDSQDQVANTNVDKVIIDPSDTLGGSSTKTNGCQNDRGIKS